VKATNDQDPNMVVGVGKGMVFTSIEDEDVAIGNNNSVYVLTKRQNGKF